MSANAFLCPKCNERFGPEHMDCPKDGTPLVDAAMADALLHREIGNFKVERILGAGGMGMVFMARHKSIGTQAVVKILGSEMVRVRDAKIRFFNEAKLSSAIIHPNVVRIFDFGELPEGILYMVMEFVPGDDLSGVLKRDGKLDAIRAARIMRQVASALDAAHTAPNGPVIHRDLKPANIRISRRAREEHATVLDFGIAKAVDNPGDERLTVQGTVIGTPRYMAPEQAAGDPVDRRTDVYALGVIAYELVSGTTPYQTSRLVELISRQIYMPIPPLKPELKVPREYEVIVRRCLEKEPKDRYQSSGELCEALDQFLGEVGAAKVRRRASLSVAAALLLGGAGAGAAYFLGPAPGAAPGVVLELTGLTADGRDVLSAPTLFVRGERARLDARVGGLESIVHLGPEVQVSLDGKPLATERRNDGFAAIVGPLEAGKRPPVEIAVVFGEPDARKRVDLLKRPICRDGVAPHLEVRALDGAPFRVVGAGLHVFRAAEAEIEVGIAEDGALATGGVIVSVDAPLKAEVVSVAAGTARVKLELGGLRPDDVSVVKLRASDLAGNEGRLAVPIVYDPVPPALDGLAVEGAEPLPATPGADPAFLVRADAAPLPREVVVRVRARDTQGVSSLALRLDAAAREGDARVIAETVAPDRSSGAFTVSIREEGTTRAVLVAADGAGNVVERPLALRCEVPLQASVTCAAGPGAPPVLVGADTSLAVAAAEVEIAGRVNKALRAIEVVREAPDEPALVVPAATTPDGRAVRFTARLPLLPRRAQVIAVRFIPESGEAERRAWPIVHDDEPPAITVARPSPWPERIGLAALEGGAFVIERKAEDPLAGVVAASERVRAFEARSETDAASAEVVLVARGLGAGAVPGLVELSVEALAGGVARILRPPAGATLLVAIEAADRAGNRRTEVRRTRVESEAVVVLATPEARSVTLHEPIQVAIETRRPVASVRVNGSAEGVTRVDDTHFRFAAAMFLDTPEVFAVEATDPDGVAGRTEARVARDPRCRNLTDEDAPLRSVDEKAMAEIFARYGAARCPHCQKPLYGGKKPQ